MSQCIGEVEWLQIFYRDLIYNDVQVKDWHKSLMPYTIYLPEECELVARQEQCQITDAKSLYDAIFKQCPASRQDRRTALELAVIVDAVQKAGSAIPGHLTRGCRWTCSPRWTCQRPTGRSSISYAPGSYELTRRTQRC